MNYQQSLAYGPTCEPDGVDSYHMHKNGQEKEHVLQMLDIVQEGLQKAWTISSRKKKKKMAELELIRRKIIDADESKIGLALDDTIASRCLPRREIGFGKRYSYAHKEMTRHISAALTAVDAHTTSIRSDAGTAGTLDAKVDFMIELENEGTSIDSSARSSVISAQYDADAEYEKNDKTSDTIDEADLSEEDSSENVVVTTSNLKSDDGPLGVSITTWRRHKFSGTKKSPNLDNSLETSDDDVNTLEEVNISFGEGISVRATTRTKCVRFVDIKPTAEDNIARAKELLKNARLLQST